ncbi:MAG: COQ9 family protein [Roseomonas sp.]|nr:COQ9 family protein [Roseomonas sp.]MCA3343136.1 COQ9 family protein [Roseomonas sp.]
MEAGPDRDARDAALDAILPLVPLYGWQAKAIAEGLRDAGMAPEDAEWMFPRGAISAIEAWIDLADRRMEAAGLAADLAGMRTHERVRFLIKARLEAAEPHRDALRAALSVLAMPWNAPIAARSLARSVSAIWYTAGDKSADFSWYTRRATLAGIYSATLAFWLSGRGDGLEAALGFLDRRLADHACFQKGLARLKPRAA